MGEVTLPAFAAHIRDLCAASPFVSDYTLDIRDTVVVRCRIQLVEGFVDVYRNFRTGTTAYAWIVGGLRRFGADNTGGWHRHPPDDPARHEACPPVTLGAFFEELEGLFKERTDR